jgi:subtilisin family serine protease
VEIDFEPHLQLQECINNKTDNIFYMKEGLSIKEPNAWSIDYLDIQQDNSYNFDSNNKELVEIWILDTGVNWHHVEFDESQVVDVDPNYNIFNVSNPHGTGTSICSGGKNYGSSKGFKIYNYPVCRSGGSCGSSDIDNGFKKVLDRLENNRDQNGKYLKRVVVNLSVGANMGTDPSNSSLGMYYNSMFKKITDQGGLIVTSAGNSNQDACTWLYSFSPYVISVGALDQNYNKASFSNYGSCVDIWSFGLSVPTGYSVIDNYSVQYKSGTSFSSPLVAGLVANVLSQDLTLNKEQVLQILYYNINNYFVPRYKCGEMIKKCCQGDIKGTRKDNYCRSLDLNHCDRACVIKSC